MSVTTRLAPPWKHLLTLLALLGNIITGCGPATPEAIPSPGGPTPTVTVPVELPVTITLAGRFSAQALAVLDDQIAAFEEADPDVKVEIVTKVAAGSLRTPADRREAFATLLDRGEASLDVLVLDDAWLAEFAANGWLTPLDPHVRSNNVELDGFFPSVVQASTIDGQLVALPWIIDGGLLYYRQDLLDEYGYEAPTTWPELQKIALDVKAGESLPSGHVWQGSARESLTCNTLEFVWAYGGDVLDTTGEAIFDSPQTRTALQQMVDLVASGASPQDVATYQEGKSLAALWNGEAVSMRNWSYAWDRLDSGGSVAAGNVGVYPLPASCLTGQSLALSAHSLYPNRAFRLMRFLVDYEQQVQLAGELGYPPALEMAYRDADLLRARPFFEALHTALSLARPRPRTAVYPQVSEAIYVEVNKMLTGEQGVEATAAAIQRRIEAAVQGQ